MLSGKKVGLRAVERNDLPLLQAWRNRPDFRINFRENKELSLENQNKWFDKKLNVNLICKSKFLFVSD